MSEERSFKIIEGEDQTPIHDLTEPTSTLHVIWEEVEAGGRGFRGESAVSRIPLRDEESRGGAIENLPTNLTAIPLYDGNRIEWKEGSNTVLFRGRIGIKDYSRGRQVGGRAREIVLTAGDMNQDLTEIIVDGWARPAETDVARVQALVSTYLSGNPRRTTNINTNYVAVGSNTVTLPAKVYDATDPAAILAEIASIANKQHFVTIDQELFYDGNDSTTYQAGIRISDRLEEINYGEGLSCTPATSTPSAVSGSWASNATPTEIFVPANCTNNILVVQILGESDQQPFNASVNGTPMTAVPGALRQNSVNIPGRTDASTLQWFWAALPDTGALPPLTDHTVTWGGSYLGWTVLTDVNTSTPWAAVATAEGTNANPAVSVTPSGTGISLSGFGGWEGPAGSGTPDPTMDAPGTAVWTESVATGLGPLAKGMGTGDTTASYQWGDPFNWVAINSWVSGAASSEDTPTFPPIWDVGPASIEDGLQFLSGLRLYYGQGSNTYVYVNDPVVANKAWHAEASLYVNDDAIDTAAKATALANTLLFRRQYDERTHNCSIGPLTTEQVGCIKPGQLINIKAYAIPNADDAYISVRVAQLLWSTPVPGIFFAHLQLGSTLREQQASIGPKSATDSINRHVEQGSNSHPEYVLRSTLLFQGDLPYRGASDWTRLGLGASNTHLISDGVTPKWVLNQSGSGMTNPMTTLGDIIRGGTSGAATRLGIGASNTILASDGSIPVWAHRSADGGASGAPTDAKYVTTAFNGSLSAETAIPYLAGEPRRAPSSAGSGDDEFDTTDTGNPPTGWTALSTGSFTSADTNSTAASMLYGRKSATATGNLFGFYKAKSPAFTVTVHMAAHTIRDNFGRAGIFIAEGTPGNIETLDMVYNTGWYIEVMDWTSPSAFSANIGSSVQVGDTFAGRWLAPYFRIIVASSTDVTYQFSRDGYFWESQANWTNRNPGWTVGSVGFFAEPLNASSDVEALFDFIRFT